MISMSPEIDKILADPVDFISRLKIVNKQGRLQNLELNEEQLEIIELLEQPTDTLICKARQIGSSTVVAAYMFWRAYTSSDPVTFVILSHKLSSSKHILEMHKTFYANLPTLLKRGLSVDNTTEIKFADTGASIVLTSAGAKGGLRSHTTSMLHISEYAFMDNPEELKATAISALNGNKLIIESTANYHGDALYKEIDVALRGEANWSYTFFPWFKHAEYSLEVPEGTQFTSSELELMHQHSLSPEQIYWRRKKIESVGLATFRREYPLSLEDAFAQTGNSFFSDEEISKLEVIPVASKDITILEEPNEHDEYAIGCDVSAGVGRDYSVAMVLSKRTYRPVAIVRSKHMNTNVFAQKIQELGTWYNKAKVLVEANNYGHAVLNELRHLGYTNIWTEDGRDWITTQKSKIELFDHLKACIQDQVVTVLDNITVSELKAFIVERRDTAPTVPSNLSHHGDSVIALGLALICLKKVQLPKMDRMPDWIRKQKLQQILRQASFNNIGRS